VLEQGLQHPDLGRAEDSPATEDECCATLTGRHPWRCHDRILPAPVGRALGAGRAAALIAAPWTLGQRTVESAR
jgi:hypothetical protein